MRLPGSALDHTTKPSLLLLPKPEFQYQAHMLTAGACLGLGSMRMWLLSVSAPLSAGGQCTVLVGKVQAPAASLSHTEHVPPQHPTEARLNLKQETQFRWPASCHPSSRRNPWTLQIARVQGRQQCQIEAMGRFPGGCGIWRKSGLETPTQSRKLRCQWKPGSG